MEAIYPIYPVLLFEFELSLAPAYKQFRIQNDLIALGYTLSPPKRGVIHNHGISRGAFRVRVQVHLTKRRMSY